MREPVLFLNMFPDYQPPEQLANLFAKAVLVAADINPATRCINSVVYSPNYIPQKTADLMCLDIAGVYGLKEINITCTHPADQLHQIDPDELMNLFVAENSMTRGSLAGASWTWEANKLTVQLAANGKDILLKCVPAVCSKLRERFSADVEIVIQGGNDLTGEALYQAMEKIRGSMLVDIPSKAAVPKPEQKPQDNPAFFGKPFKGEPVPMQELSLDMGSVIVEGKVFHVEHKELKKRNAWVINFDMTDNRGSVRVNRFLENSEAKQILDNVKVGSVLKVQGRLTVNQFEVL